MPNPMKRGRYIVHHVVLLYVIVWGRDARYLQPRLAHGVTAPLSSHIRAEYIAPIITPRLPPPTSMEQYV